MEKNEYAPPKVETLDVQQLLEAVGPVQALSSGAESPGLNPNRTLRGHGMRRGRGPRD